MLSLQYGPRLIQLARREAKQNNKELFDYGYSSQGIHFEAAMGFPA